MFGHFNVNVVSELLIKPIVALNLEHSAISVTVSPKRK